MELTQLMDIVGNLGTPGIILVGFYLMYTGKLFPEAIVKVMLENMRAETKTLADEITAGMKDAITEGVKAGIHESRNGST